jgi:hypothetical protein
MDTEALKMLAQGATPGPWRRDKNSGLDADVRADHSEFPHKGYPVALTWGLWNAGASKDAQARRKASANANADFIAAANPAAVQELIASHDKLLAALRKIESHLDNRMTHQADNPNYPFWNQLWDIANIALAPAEAA